MRYLFLCLLLGGCVSHSQFVKFAKNQLDFANATERAVKKAFNDLENIENRLKSLEYYKDNSVEVISDSVLTVTKELRLRLTALEDRINSTKYDFESIVQKATEETDRKFKDQLEGFMRMKGGTK